MGGRATTTIAVRLILALKDCLLRSTTNMSAGTYSRHPCFLWLILIRPRQLISAAILANNRNSWW
jgi:hypothetical protein